MKSATFKKELAKRPLRMQGKNINLKTIQTQNQPPKKSLGFLITFQVFSLLLIIAAQAKEIISKSTQSDSIPTFLWVSLYIDVVLVALYILSNAFLLIFANHQRFTKAVNWIQLLLWVILVPNLIENQIARGLNKSPLSQYIVVAFIEIMVLILISLFLIAFDKAKWALTSATISYIALRLAIQDGDATLIIIAALFCLCILGFSYSSYSSSHKKAFGESIKDTENIFLKLLLGDSNEGFVVIGNNRSVIYANPAVQTLLQHGSEGPLLSLEQIKDFSSFSQESQSRLREKIKDLYCSQEQEKKSSPLTQYNLEENMMSSIKIGGKNYLPQCILLPSQHTKSIFSSLSTTMKTLKSAVSRTDSKRTRSTFFRNNFSSTHINIRSMHTGGTNVFSNVDSPLNSMNPLVTSPKAQRGYDDEKELVFERGIPDNLHTLFQHMRWENVHGLENFFNYEDEINSNRASQRNAYNFTGCIDDSSHNKILSLKLIPLYIKQEPFLIVKIKDLNESESCNLLQNTEQNRNFILSSVSHELRTPLNCIISMLDMLSGFVDESLKSEYIDPAHSSANLLVNLVNDILDLSQTRAGTFNLTYSQFNLYDHLQDIIQLMNLKALGKGLRLKLDFDPRVPKVLHTDPNRLRQIIINLIGNALKFTFQGSITVKIEFLKANKYQVAVEDTGVGIKTENITKLFSKFSKISDTANINHEGIGLGLVISNIIARQIGPENNEGIQVKSKYGLGTTFFFELESKITPSFEAAEAEILDISENYDLESRLNKNMSNIRDWEEKSQAQRSRVLGSAFNLGDPKLYQTITSTSKVTKGKPRINFDDEADVPIGSQYSPSNGYDFLTSFNSKIEEAKKSSPYLKVPLSSYTLNNANTIGPLGAVSSRSSVDDEASETSSYHANKKGVLSSDCNISQQQLRKEFVPRKQSRVFDAKDQVILEIARKLYDASELNDLLIIDDNPFNILALQKTLEGLNLRVDSANSGDEAIKKILAREEEGAANYKIIFMDCIMPIKDGYQTTKELRVLEENKEIPFIPILAVTASTQPDEVKKCHDSGMNDYLTKPIELNVLKEKLIQYLGSYSK